ncbi:MAG TPA: hypothetical protein VGL93_17100 [Streptosporangiaceae bacterium]
MRETLADIEAVTGATAEVINADFLPWALTMAGRFDIVIQNPPYAKLRTGSDPQNLLRAAGISVPNTYAAFLALGLRVLDEGASRWLSPRGRG